MEIMDCLMFVMIAGCIFGMCLTISFTRKKVLSILKGAGLGVLLAACAFMCCVMLVLPMDEPREYNTCDERAVVQIEDDFVVVQLGDRLDTIPRNLHPITNWEPVEGNISREIISKETNLVNTANGIVCELITHYKDGSVRRDSISFKNTTKPNSNWEPVR